MVRVTGRTTGADGPVGALPTRDTVAGDPRHDRGRPSPATHGTTGGDRRNGVTQNTGPGP